MALLLAGLGLYGVTSYAVTRRRAEIGIRMALGAEPAGVVRLVLVRVFMLVALGVIIGTAVSVWSSQSIASLLYDLRPRDAVTLVSAAVMLTSVCAIAGWLPAYHNNEHYGNLVVYLRLKGLVPPSTTRAQQK